MMPAHAIDGHDNQHRRQRANKGVHACMQEEGELDQQGHRLREEWG